MVNYIAGDFLIQLKNAARAGKKEVVIRHTKYAESIALALKAEHYLDSVEVKDGKLIVNLKFHKKMPILMDVKLKSRPGLRLYADVDMLESKKGASILLISTPHGVMSSKKAIKARTGGEIIAEVL